MYEIREFYAYNTEQGDKVYSSWHYAGPFRTLAEAEAAIDEFDPYAYMDLRPVEILEVHEELHAVVEKLREVAGELQEQGRYEHDIGEKLDSFAQGIERIGVDLENEK